MVSWCSPISASMLPTVCRKVCQPTPWMPNLANAGLILRLSTAVSGTAAPTNHADVSAGLRHLLPAFDINRASASGKEVRVSWSRIRRSRLGGGRVCELRRRTRLRIALASARGQHWRKRCARVAVAPVLIRVQMLRIERTYDLLITRHQLAKSGNSQTPHLDSSILFYGRRGGLEMELWGKDV